MTTFYFIRHGKTELNVLNSYQGGGVDSPLLTEGIEQAVQLGQHLADIRFDAAAVSTQKRAMDTANYILAENNHRNKLTVTYWDSLKEIGFGEKEGLTVDLEDQQTQYLRTRPDLYDPSSFGGETYNALMERGAAVVEELKQMYPKGKVLLVAHGVLLIVLTNYLLGKEKKNWRQNGPLENTSVTILQSEGEQFKLERFNDISYQSTQQQTDEGEDSL